MNSNDLVTSVIRPEVRAISAYHVADAQGLIKLDAMENPYDWPDDIKHRWLTELQNCSINRYPDPDARVLAETLRKRYSLPIGAGLVLGNGSDEIIQMLLMALPSNSSVLSVTPGFVMYKQISDCLGLNYIGVPLTSDSFELDISAMLTAIARHRPLLIFLAYPNNPTGNLFNKDHLMEIVEAAPGIVVIDEAYEPFAGTSLISELGQFDNLMIMRTVSKLGLAGLRLGYLAGSPDLIKHLNKIRLPYNINILTQVSANFALSNKNLLDEQTQLICQERAALYQQLKQFDGMTVYPSAANFILFRTQLGQADTIFASLKHQGVLIKNLNSQGGLLNDCLRVTIGRPEENAKFLQALRKSH